MSDKLLQSPLFEESRIYLTKIKAKQQIFLYVPFIKTKVLKKLVEGISNKITIITTWDINDLISGSSDIELYQWCKENGNYLYIHDSIHLKVYSVNFESAIVTSGNISHKGLMPNGNYEAGVFVEKLSNEDRIYLEKIKNEARFVDDNVFQQYFDNFTECKKKAINQEKFPQPKIKSKEEFFLRSSLPMTENMEDVIKGYLKINSNLPPSKDTEIANCIFHDIANYNIPKELSEEGIRKKLKKQFLSHPFTKKIIDEIDNHERKHFGKIKNWIRDNCTEVPLPRPWEFNKNTEILMQWLVESGEYEKFYVGEHTPSIKRISSTVNVQRKNTDQSDLVSRLVLFSVAGDAAFEHYENTILNNVKTDNFPTSEMKKLPKVRMWGANDRSTNKNRSKWSKLKKGDILLFYRDKKYVTQMTISGIEDNYDIAKMIWGEKKDHSTMNVESKLGETWQLIMYAEPDNVRQIDVTKEDLNKLLDYKESFMPTRTLDFMPVNESKLQEVHNQFGSIQKALESI